MKKSMIFYTTDKLKKWSLPALFFLFLIFLLIYSVYFLSVSPPSEDMSRGFAAGSLKAEDIASNIANNSRLIKLSEQNLAVIFCDNGSLSFDVYDQMLEKTKSFDTNLKSVTDFDASGDKDRITLSYIKDNALYKTIYNVKDGTLSPAEKLSDDAEFVKMFQGYILYDDGNRLLLKTPSENTISVMTGEINKADMVTKGDRLEIAAEVREQADSRIDHIKLENDEITDIRTIGTVSTNSYTKIRNVLIFQEDESSDILYSVRDNKSKQISYYLIEDKTAKNLAFLKQDSKPFITLSSPKSILFTKAIDKGNGQYFQIAQMEHKEEGFIDEKLLTKGKVFAGNPEVIDLSGSRYLKYEAVNAFSKDVYLASSKPQLIEKSTGLMKGELKAILTDSLSFAAFAYALSLSYFGYIFIFAALIFFSSMFFFVGWTERNPHKLMLIIAFAHLAAGIITLNSYLLNTQNSLQLPGYLMNPLIPLGLTVMTVIAGLWTVFRGYDTDQLKHRLWEAYFQFFAVSSVLYMLIYFPFLAYNYL